MNTTRSDRQRGGAALSLVLLVAVSGAAAFWWWRTNGLPQNPIDLDRIVTIERKDLIRAVLATGRIEPLARIMVMSRASGIVKTLHVEAGDRVKVGQVLADLDPSQLVAQHQRNVGDLDSAIARVLGAKARLEEAKIKLVDPELEFARDREKRVRALFEASIENQDSLEDAIVRRVNIEFRVQQIKASIPVLEAGIAQAEADEKSYRAEIDVSETALRETTILSSVDGIVLTRDKEVGDGVSSILTAGGNATAIMTLGDVSQMFVKAKVDEVDVGKITEGMPSLITVDAFRDDPPFKGRVVRIAPSGTVDNNGIVTFEVKVLVSDPEGKLRVDMTANTRFVLEARPQVLAIPQKALVRTKSGTWEVQRIESDEPPIVKTTVVKVGVSDGLASEVIDGLAEGDRVMLAPEAGPSASRG